VHAVGGAIQSSVCFAEQRTKREILRSFKARDGKLSVKQREKRKKKAKKKKKKKK